MPEEDSRAHPYIPNSAPAVKKAMLEEVGVRCVDDFYEDVPPSLRIQGYLNLPPALRSEWALQRHIEGILSRNITSGEYLSFLGGGCYQHHVPAVCDEVNQRGEFLTAYAGEPYDDHGRFQALFEYASMMGELLDMDVVNVPTYDGFQATATALSMAARITGREKLIICRSIDPDKLSRITDYNAHALDIVLADYDRVTGQIDLQELDRLIDERTAAVYFENPGYFGVIESQGDQIARIAHDRGALCVVSANPISLGVLTPPAGYGADIVCGDIQPLGMHMQYGGGQAGYIATRDEPRFVMEYPSRLFGVAPTRVPGEYGFGDVAYERTSFAIREEGKEWVGTATALWGITAGVYLALMGPQGMVEIGRGIMARARYAMNALGQIPGIKSPLFYSPHFGEFVININNTGTTVAEINKALLQQGIFGGKDLSQEFPELGQSALLSITEVHTRNDIDQLANAVKEIVGS